MRKERKMKGFTLVELLIVLLILGILIGLAVPRYLRALDESKRTTFCSNVRNIESALETYRIQNSTLNYPDNLNDILTSTTYFSQKPINPYTQQPFATNTGTEGENGYFSYSVGSDKTTYTIVTNPPCEGVSGQ